MAEDGKKRLGKGLAALLGDIAEETTLPQTTRDGIRKVALSIISSNPRNPRLDFDLAQLNELAASIKVKGVLSPILVRTHPLVPGNFELIAGERRWRAAQLAGLTEIPVLVQDVTDQESLEIALIENIQRADLNVIDEALGYQHLMKDFDYKHDQIAAVVSKSRSHITNILRMLKLPESIQKLVRTGELSAGHAKILVGNENAEEIAKTIIAQGWSVRDLENAMQQQNNSVSGIEKNNRVPLSINDFPELLEMERRIGEQLGLKIKIVESGSSGNGHIRIYYNNNEQFDHIVDRLVIRK